MPPEPAPNPAPAESGAPNLPNGVPPASNPPPGAAPEPQGPYATFPTAEAFQERVGRAARAQIKELFGLDPEEAKARIARLDELEAEDKKRRDAELSELEKARLASEETAKKLAVLEAERDQLQFQAHITRLCATRGIRDVDYAQFRIMKQAEQATEEAPLDEEKYLDELLADPRHRVALGVEQPAANGAPPPEPKPNPATTSPQGASPHQQPASDPAQPASGPKSAFELSQSEWEARKRTLGIA